MKAMVNEIIVVGFRFPSKHRGGVIVSDMGVSPTIMENHGLACAIETEENDEVEDARDIR